MADLVVGSNGEITVGKKKKKSNFIVDKNGNVQVNEKVRGETETVKVGGSTITQPKKEKKKKDSWFTSGAFSDGYQFGDVTKTVFGTGGDVLTNLGKGGFSIIEGLGDAVNYGVAGIADMAGADQFAKDLRAETSKSLSNKIFNPAEEFYDKSSVIGEKGDNVTQALGNVGGSLLTGGLGKMAGLGSKGVTLLVTGQTAVSGYGSGTSQAYQAGATDEEAHLYGIINGASEAGTEMLFGGLGKTMGAVGFDTGILGADDWLAKKIGGKISSELGRQFAEFGIKAGAEGSEEVIAGLIQGFGKYYTYQTEQDGFSLQQILADEELLDQFIVGMVTSGIVQTPGLYKSTKAGRDFVTGYTQNEQKVVDREIQNRIAEAEADGTKLTSRQKSKIETEVKEDFEKGVISTDTIESELGGEAYSQLQEQRNRKKELQTEIDSLLNKKNSEITVAEIRHLEALEQELASMDTNTLENQLRSEMDGKIEKDNYLKNAYYQKAQRGRAFEYEVSEKDSEYKTVVYKSAVDAGANNTLRTHEMADTLAKLSEDRGVQYKFTSTKQLQELGLVPKGKTANGLYVVENDGKREVLVNLDSKKYLESVLVHETAHDFKTTDIKSYEELERLTKQYAEANGDYSRIYSEVVGMYKDVEGVNINDEVTARLLEDYLGNKDFISELSTKKPSIVKKFIDSIKNFYKRLKAGSPEARKVEKLRQELEEAYKKAYRQTEVKGDTDTRTQQAIGGLKGVNNIENSEYMQEFLFAYDKANEYKNKGKDNEYIRQKTGWFQDKNGDWKFEFSDKDMTLKPGVTLEAGKEYNLEDILEHKMLFELYPELKTYKVKFKSFDSKNIILKLLGKDKNYKKLGNYTHETHTINLNNHFLSIADFKKAVESTLIHEIQHSIQHIEGFEHGRPAWLSRERYYKSVGEIEATNTSKRIDMDMEQRLKEAPESSKADPKHPRYDAYMEKRGIIDKLKDSLYTYFEEAIDDKILKKLGIKFKDNDIGVGEYGDSRRYGLADDNNQEKGLDDSSFFNGNNTTDNQGRTLTKEQQEHFKDSKVRDENGNLLTMYHGTSSGGHTVFDPWGAKVGLFGQGSYFTDNKSVAESYTEKGKGSNKQIYEVYLNITNPIDMDAQGNIQEWTKALSSYGADIGSYLESGTNEQIYRSALEYLAEEGTYDKYERAEIMAETFEKMGYDGITHIGGGRFNKQDGTRHRVYISLDSNQVKNVDNTKPTSNPDIRYSLSEDIAPVNNEYLVNEETDTEKQYFYRGQERTADKLDFNSTTFQGDSEGGVYFTSDEKTASKYGKNIIKLEKNDGNTVSVEESNKLHEWANKQVERDIANMVESDYVIEQMALGRPRAFAEYTKKPFVETGDLFGEPGEAIYYEEVANGTSKYGVFDDEDYSLSNESDVAPMSTDKQTSGQDLIIEETIENAIAPLQEEIAKLRESLQATIQEGETNSLVEADSNALNTGNEYAPLTEDDLPGFYAERDSAPIGEAPVETEVEQGNIPDLISMDNKSLRRLTRNMKQELGLNKTQTDELERIIQDFSLNEYATREDLFETIKENFSEQNLRYRNDDIAQVKRDLRNRRIKVPSEVKTDLKDEFYAIKQRTRGKLNLVNDGTPIDSVYQELSELYPAHFPSEINTEADQLIRLSEVANLDIVSTEKFVLPDDMTQELTDFIYDSVQDYKLIELSKMAEQQTKLPIDESLIPPIGDTEIGTEIGTEVVTEDIAPVRQTSEAIRPKPERVSTNNRMIRVSNTQQTTQPSVVESDVIQAPGLKERRWVSTSTESEVVNREVLPDDLDQNKIFYQPIPNTETLGKANTKIETLGYDQALAGFKSKIIDKKIELVDIAVGERLIQEAIKRGDTKTAGELIQDVAMLGTELGQKVQALSIIQRMTPAGQLKMLEKTINRGKIKEDKSFEGLELTQEMKDKILNTYKPDGTYDVQELNRVVEEVKNELASNMKVTAMEKINAWRYLSMLGNPKTHIRNLVSNVAMKATTKTKDILARTIEGVTGIENRTKTWERSTDAVKEYARETTLEMKDVLSDDNRYSEETGIKQRRDTFKNRILNGVYNFNSDLLAKEDWWFSKGAFEKSFSEFLTANGIRTREDITNNPEIIEKAKNYATERSQIATFRQYSWLANKIRDIENKNVVTQVAVGSVLPFKKTPINIAKTGLAYSPLGFAKTLTYDIAQVKKGKMEASTLIDHIAQNTTGTALTLIGFMLARAGFLNGGGEDDKEGKYDYQLGEQAYSLNIGDKTYSLSWLSPVAIPMFVGANAYEQLVEGKEWNGDVVVETLAQTLDPLSEMSFLSGINTVLSSYDSGMEKFAGMFESMAQNYITQFVPTLSSQVASTLDDKKRTTKVAGDSDFKFVDETKNKLMYKIPGLRNLLEPSTDIWGNEIKQSDNILERAFDNFIAPYSAKENITSDVDLELKELYGEVGDNGLLPNVPYNYVNYGGEKYNMSASEYTDFKKQYGQTSYEMLEELFDTTTYKNASREDKANMVNRVYDYARDEAKKDYLAGEGVEYTNATKKKVPYYKENPIKGAIENDITVEEFDFSVKYPEKYDFLEKNNISYKEYDATEESRDAYNWAYKNQENYTLSKAVTSDIVEYRKYSSDLYDLKADKKANGKTVNGSRKAKVIDYINSLDIDYGSRLILYKKEYTSDDTYNREIINYLMSRDDISYEETVTILTELDMKVDSKGNVRW